MSLLACDNSVVCNCHGLAILLNNIASAMANGDAFLGGATANVASISTGAVTSFESHCGGNAVTMPSPFSIVDFVSVASNVVGTGGLVVGAVQLHPTFCYCGKTIATDECCGGVATFAPASLTVSTITIASQNCDDATTASYWYEQANRLRQLYRIIMSNCSTCA